MSDIVMTIDAKDAIAAFEGFKKQIPFATMVALNRTAEDVLASLRKEVRERFVVRQPRFVLPPQQLPREWRATKSNLSAFIGLGPKFDPMALKRRRILEPFEAGTPKRMGTYPVAIPTKVVRPNFSDKVPQRMLPRNLIGIFDMTGTLTGMDRKARVTQRTSKRKGQRATVTYKQVGRYFVLGDSNEKSWGLYERKGRGSKGDIRRLWTFRTQVSRPPNLRLVETSNRIVSLRWTTNAAGAIDLAIRTARLA